MSTKSKTKKTAPVKKAKLPLKPSAPMKAALTAVANMPVRKDSKLEAIIKLLSRPEGATIDDMVTATGWQKHTIRSALSHALVKKRSYQIASDKPKGENRIYKIAAGLAAKQ